MKAKYLIIRFIYFFRLVFVVFFALKNTNSLYAQKPTKLIDGLNLKECDALNKMIDAKPKEVLWGIEYGKNNEVYITLTNKDWLFKILKSPTDGIAVDLIEKEKFACQANFNHAELIRGEVLPPLYLQEIKKQVGDKEAKIEIGKIPKNLEGREIEGNLMLVNENKVCFYQSFIQVPRSSWNLLPMGYFTNTYIQENREDKLLIFEKKLQFIVPFPKNKATYNPQDLKIVFDSLQNTDFKIKRIDIRAYASVEGSKENNALLQEKRANAVIDALKVFQMDEVQRKVSTAENWLEFLNDIQNSDFKQLLALNQNEIKQELTKKDILEKIEPILQKHRKAVLIVYLDKKTGFEQIPKENLLTNFQESLQKKDIKKAIAVQKEAFNRINEQKLPTDFLDKLEIPKQKNWSVLANNTLIYSDILATKQKKEILAELEKLARIDSLNGRLRYNICVFKFKVWEKDSTALHSNTFFEEIKSLRNLKINQSLVRRMIMNYYIIKSEQQLARNDYKGKDFSVDFIRKRYTDLDLADEDLLSLSRFLVFYVRKIDALNVIKNRIDKIDVNEDLLFYYINLKLFDEKKMEDTAFKNALENAVVLNKNRFCKYFNAISRGGASFQLLDEDKLRKFYCENCQ